MKKFDIINKLDVFIFTELEERKFHVEGFTKYGKKEFDVIFILNDRDHKEFLKSFRKLCALRERDEIMLDVNMWRVNFGYKP
jgi:hypothetical protein